MNAGVTVVEVERSKAYKDQSEELLKYHFSLLSVTAVLAVLRRHGDHFTSAFHELTTIDIYDSHEIIVQYHPCLVSTAVIVIQKPRNQKRPSRQTDRDLIAELDALPALQNKKENHQPLPAGPKQLFEKEFTCERCFEDFGFDEGDATHLVCADCLDNRVHEQVFGNDNSEFACMSSEKYCCTGEFSTRSIDKAETDAIPALNTKENHHHSQTGAVVDLTSPSPKKRNVTAPDSKAVATAIQSLLTPPQKKRKTTHARPALAPIENQGAAARAPGRTGNLHQPRCSNAVLPRGGRVVQAAPGRDNDRAQRQNRRQNQAVGVRRRANRADGRAVAANGRGDVVATAPRDNNVQELIHQPELSWPQRNIKVVLFVASIVGLFLWT